LRTTERGLATRHYLRIGLCRLLVAPHPELEAIASPMPSPQAHPHSGTQACLRPGRCASCRLGRGGHARRGPNWPLLPWWDEGVLPAAGGTTLDEGESGRM